MYYYSLDAYLKNEFGTKTYKLALHSGCSCPNRDGTIGMEGCIFCGEKGSGDFAQSPEQSVFRQIEAAKVRVSKKISVDSYIAYFQSFSNTYGPYDKLAPLFQEAIAHPHVVALSIATRPDCISEEMYSLLFSLAKIKPVWIELGLQTMHDRTARLIRRGFDLPCFVDCVKKLRSHGIKVIVHLILGLPGESADDILASVDYLGRIGADGVKLQLLHVLRGTRLAEMYDRQEVQVLSREEYIDLLGTCIEHLPRNMPVHRLTGDGPKSLLIAPLWSADKRSVRNAIDKAFREKNIEQGRLCPSI